MSSMRPQATHQQASGSRHHPYGAQPAAGPSTSTVPGPAAGRKHARKSEEQREAAMRAPLSPPRTQRDSRSPPANLEAAFGGKDGGKWWDEELPAPPASLSSILDSFRRSGEGDRDLLLAILGAKKAEEERLTSLITTRLTILQARLSVHQTSMQLDAAATMPMPMPMPPHPPMSMGHSPRDLAAPLPERTPSLTSRGSTTSSAGPLSPGLAASYATVYDRERDCDPRRDSDDERRLPSHATRPFHLPPPRNLWRRHGSPSEDGPVPVLDAKKPYLPSMAARKGEAYVRRRSISPREDASGIDMLLDAGRRAAQ